uniref:Chromo domain-containing protein n=1 Tax=Ditylenchus dipsaci TaxID=166011 RepID=A0A915D988_9BILA
MSESDDSSGGELEGGSGYVVEAILNKRSRMGITEYLVKWKAGSPLLIKEFEEGKKREKQKHREISSKDKNQTPASSRPRKPIKGERKDSPHPYARPAPKEESSQGAPSLLPEPTIDSTNYGVQRGMKIIRILGVRPGHHIKGLVAMVIYEEGMTELVPTMVLSLHAAKQMVAFYEDRLRFEEEYNPYSHN